MGLSGGLAERLGLGRSTVFDATVTVHELSQVPLVNAKFRCKWKFKGATTGPAGSDAAIKDAADEVDSVSRRYLHPLSSHHRPAARSSSGVSRRAESTEDSSGRSCSPPASPPMSPSELRTPNPNRTPSAPQSASAFSFTSPFASNNENGGGSVLPSWSHSSTPDDSPSAGSRRRGAADLAHLPSPSSAHPRTEPKGSTGLIPLRNHTATFSREIQCPVSIPLRALNGGRYQLQPSPLKITIRQEIIGDEGKKEDVKTGEVVLDLSQFVTNSKSGSAGQGQARRYLLHDCKTNATLKITVKMEFLSGEKQYVAPPLRSGQLKPSASSSGLLNSSSSSIHNKSSTSLVSKSKASNGRSHNASSASLPRTMSSSSVSTGSALSTSSHSASVASGQKTGWHPSTNGTSSFSNSPSPTLGGTENDHTAVDLIETLFNRASRQPSWSSLPKTPSAVDENKTLGGRDEALVFAVGRAKRNDTGSTLTTVKGKGKAASSQKQIDHDGADRLSPVRTRPGAPQSQAASSPNKTSSSSSHLGSGRPSGRPQQLSRQSSLSSHSNASSRKVSVRWGDDSRGHDHMNGNGHGSEAASSRSVSGPAMLATRPQSSSTRSIASSNSSGILRTQSSESSLGSSSSSREPGLDRDRDRDRDHERNDADAKSRTLPPSLSSSGIGPKASAPSLSGSTKSKMSATSASASKKSEEKGRSNAGGIEWAKSWG